MRKQIIFVILLLGGCSTIEYGGFRRTALFSDLSFSKLHSITRPDGTREILVEGVVSEQTKALEAVARGAAAGAKGGMP